MQRPLLNRIVNHLLINFQGYPDNGLLTGKMGGVLFFSVYASAVPGKAYLEDYAGELMEEVLGDLSRHMPLSFAQGLCGIGWGVDFLLRNGFFEGDCDEILEEIDDRVREIDPSKVADLSFETGLAGIAEYVAVRQHAERRPFDDHFIEKMYKKLARNGNCSSGINPDYYDRNKTQSSKMIRLPAFLFRSEEIELSDIGQIPLGITKGLTGIAFNLLANDGFIHY